MAEVTDVTIEQPMELDERALSAMQSKDEMESLIEDFKPFLYARVFKYGALADETQREEMLGTAMLAFYESIQKYDASKGHFFPFANRVVCERLIDFNRKARKLRSLTVPLEDDDEDQSAAQSAAINEISISAYQAGIDREELVWEIEQFKAEIAIWGITMATLAEQSPKHKKLRDECRMAVAMILQTPAIIQTIQVKRYFPIKAIADISGLPQKKLERARSFILASLLIKMGDYRHLSAYVSDR